MVPPVLRLARLSDFESRCVCVGGGGEGGFHCVHCGIVKVGVWGGGVFHCVHCEIVKVGVWGGGEGCSTVCTVGL